MLNSINLDDKSYQELMEEALAKIPLYSAEWTNFNRSDPGITILQNFSAFHALQQSAINEVTEAVRRKLLALAGYEARQNRAASVLLQAPKEGLSLPPQYRLQLGGLPFETERAVERDRWGLAAVYMERAGEFQEISYLLDARVAVSAAVFGSRPAAGASLCCILEGTPETRRPVTLWAECPADDVRNPFPASGGPSFAATRWQYYTEKGWQDARAEDETRGFLASGTVTLHLDRGRPALYREAPIAGCAIRCLLEEARYDRPPRLLSLAANLFPVRQWETHCWCYCLPGGRRVELFAPPAEWGNLFVYCRETPGGPYRSYAPFTGAVPRGRFYRREERPGGVALIFDPVRYGSAPCGDPDAVRVVCYDGEMVHHRDLGLIYGYEDQEIPLDLVENVLPDRFLVLAEVPGPEEAAYFFVPPGGTDPERLCYEVDPSAGLLHIRHPGPGTGCRLYLCSCCTTRGAAGNIRSGGRLEHRGGLDGQSVERAFQNPAPGRGGVSYESPEELRRRFASDIRHPAAAVLPSDYEALVQRTPGLCIHKVRAVAEPQENLVRIAVKPQTGEPFPKLPSLYLREIRAWLEPRRMLTTRIELLQPQYIPVDVRAVLYIKSYFEHAERDAVSLLKAALDYVNGPQPFGGRVRFSHLYQGLLGLPCVEAVEDLRLLPGAHTGIRVEGADLLLDDRSLCYPGQIDLELRTLSSLDRR